RLRVCCFAFFLCPAPHRCLHSFPPRRSSDLHAVAQIVLRVRPRGLIDEVTTGPHRPDDPRAHAARGQRLGGGSGVPSVRMLHRQDRKSTRLNSSHVSISYAVFCLKKKKNTLI